MTSSQTRVLVLGAGELGTAVLKAFAAHPQRGSITVLLRANTTTSSDPAKVALIRELGGLGISVTSGDIASLSEQELAKAFSPFDTVIGCTGMFYGAGTQLKIARAVLAANVRRYIPWQFGADYDAIGRDSSQDLFTEQLDVRELLRGQQQTGWVIVSTGMFTSFLFEPSFGAVSADRTTVRALGDWANEVTVTTPGDIGRVVAEIMWAAPEVQGVVFTAGETVSYRRLAEILERAWGTEVGREEWSVEMLKGELAQDPGNGMKKYRVVFAEGKGVAWSEDETFNKERGLKMQGVEEWVRRNRP